MAFCTSVPRHITILCSLPKVAEMTGRSGRLVLNDRGQLVYKKRSEGVYDSQGHQVKADHVNLHERREFMEGRKLVAIISEAASCGISLQVDARFG